MLSRISKMSVFGIAALMLAFAFTGGEALAAPGNRDRKYGDGPDRYP